MKLTLNLPMLAGKSVTYYHETASKGQEGSLASISDEDRKGG